MKCMYYNKHMDTVLEYCKCLYKLEGCGAGGPLHILLDDDNYDDDDILYCLGECLRNPEHEGSQLGIVICTEYLRMNKTERVVFDWYWSGHNLECKNKCCAKCRLLNTED